ncbi:MAG: hypothetical protein AAFR94_03940, partial [Pseudomonadota bacterium]
MRTGGRISAAILVLEDVLTRRTPVNAAVRDWGKRARYAGSKDRAWISGLVLDALRRKNSIAHAMGQDDARALRPNLHQARARAGPTAAALWVTRDRLRPEPAQASTPRGWALLRTHHLGQAALAP